MTIKYTAPVLSMAALIVGSSMCPVAANALPYGPDTCIQGLVWREAGGSDTVCVRPAVREQVALQTADAAAQSNLQRDVPAAPQGSTVTFLVTGSGKAMTVDIDPSTERYYDVPLPFTLTQPLAPGEDMLQVVAVGNDSAGCEIRIDDVVVASQPPGGSAHCIWTP